MYGESGIISTPMFFRNGIDGGIVVESVECFRSTEALEILQVPIVCPHRVALLGGVWLFQNNHNK